MSIPMLCAALAASACMAEEPALDGVWQISSLDGAGFAARARIDLSEAGRISGHGPCNGFSGPRGAVLPAMDLGPFRTTKRACPDLSLESMFLTRLARTIRADRDGDTLVLSDPAGGRMVFTRVP